jgi:hypothetical protein
MANCANANRYAHVMPVKATPSRTLVKLVRRGSEK